MWSHSPESPGHGCTSSRQLRKCICTPHWPVAPKCPVVTQCLVAAVPCRPSLPCSPAIVHLLPQGGGGGQIPPVGPLLHLHKGLGHNVQRMLRDAAPVVHHLKPNADELALRICRGLGDLGGLALLRADDVSGRAKQVFTGAAGVPFEFALPLWASAFIATLIGEERAKL